MSLTAKQKRQLNDGLVTSKMKLGDIIDAIDNGVFSVNVVGGTGGISAAKFVYISGYDTDEDKPEVLAADANGTGTYLDVYFAPAAIAEGEVGTVYKQYTLTGQNTSGGSAKDPVYLSETAGGWTLTKPSGAGTNIVEVGTISVSHASTGVINIDLGGERVMAHTHADAANGGSLTLTDARILVGNGSNVATAVAVSGDATLANTGALTIAASAVTVAKCADAVQDLLRSLTITAGAEAAHARLITIQAKDAAGNNLAARVPFRLLVNASAEYGAASATGTDTFGAPGAGTNLVVTTAKADYTCITDATGAYTFSLTHNDAGTSRWFTALCGSIAASSGEVSFNAV